MNQISELISDKGGTIVNIKVKDNSNDLFFKLKNKRNIDRKSINILRNQNILATIN